jgi:hypothetical protein
MIPKIGNRFPEKIMLKNWVTGTLDLAAAH